MTRKCFRCGAEDGGTTAIFSGLCLCPACRLIEQQEEAEKRRVEAEKERRWEEERRREEERERREAEELRREEEREREREREEEREEECRHREKEKADAAAEALLKKSSPNCKWCGKSYTLENGHGFGEYCCRKCADADKVDVAGYESRLDAALLEKVREQLDRNNPLTAALYAVGVNGELPFELLSRLVPALEGLDLCRGGIRDLYLRFDAPFQLEAGRRKKQAALRRLKKEEAQIRREREEKNLKLSEEFRRKRREEEKSKHHRKGPEPDIVCPFCGKTAKGDRSLEGMLGECPYCGKEFVISFGAPDGMSAKPNDADRRPVIGVCGHKDIVTPKEEVLRALAAFWDKLAAERPQESPPLLLDSLAEGGDQIVLESRPHNVSYVAVLPFASAEYEKDFETPEAKRVYRAYLDAAVSVVVAGDHPGDYTFSSKYLLKHSDMILALWDCVITDGAPAPGGSWHTVTLALAAGLRVIVIPTRRRKTYAGGQKCIFPAECRPFELNGDLSLTEF